MGGTSPALRHCIPRVCTQQRQDKQPVEECRTEAPEGTLWLSEAVTFLRRKPLGTRPEGVPSAGQPQPHIRCCSSEQEGSRSEPRCPHWIHSPQPPPDGESRAVCGLHARPPDTMAFSRGHRQPCNGHKESSTTHSSHLASPEPMRGTCHATSTVNSIGLSFELHSPIKMVLLRAKHRAKARVSHRTYVSWGLLSDTS